MNSKIIYDKLMKRAIGRVYIKGLHERHHIIPKSMGGSNRKENIVCLTYREHFLAHWLLTKFTQDKDRIKMLHALFRMSVKNKYHSERIIAGWQYAVTKLANIEALSLRMIGNQNGKGTKRDENFCRQQSERMIGNQNGKGNKGSEKLIASLIGNKRSLGCRKTKDQKDSISRKMIGNKYGLGKNTGGGHYKAKAVRCKNDGNEFPSIIDASLFYSVKSRRIRAVCQGKQKETKGLKFEYIIKMAQAA
jgi:hypothetical protein